MNTSVWLAAACVAAQMLAPGAAIAQAKAAPASVKGADPSLKDKAKNYVKSGDRSAAAGEWEDAYADYSIAWTMFQDWEIALGLGKAAYRTRHYAEAFERLSYSLREAPGNRVSPKQRTEVATMIADAKTKTGTLAIAAAAGAEVFVDRAPVGKTPLSAAVRVDPGKHEIEIRRGAAGETKTVEVAAGAGVDVSFVAPRVPDAKPPVALVPTTSGAWRTGVVIGGGALTVAGLAIGGISLGFALDKGAAKQAAASDPSGLDATRTAAAAEADARNVALWGFVGAGIAAAGTAVLYFATRPAAKSKLQGAVGFDGNGPSIVVQGQF
jgi:hypothetical protein